MKINRTITIISVILALNTIMAGAVEQRPDGNTGTGLFVKNGKIYDPSGTEFIPMGYNIALGRSALAKANHANIVRIVSVTPDYGNGWNTTVAQHRSCVEETIVNKLVPMLEMHDATGSVPEPAWSNIKKYWKSAEVVKMAKDHEKYLLINIANEHDFASDEAWRDEYVALIKELRTLGVNNMVVLDPGFAFGQGPNGVKKYFQAIIDADPQHNVLFSIHIYAYWRTEEKRSEVGVWNSAPNGGGDPWSAEDEFQWFKDHHVPVILGEFAWHTPSSDNVVQTNGATLINAVTSRGFGFMFWQLVNNPNPGFGAYTILLTNDLVTWGPPYTLSEAGSFIVPFLETHAVESSLFNNSAVKGSLATSKTDLRVYGISQSSGTLIVTLPDHATSNVTISIVDLMGRTLYSLNHKSQTMRVRLGIGSLSKGLYIVNVCDGDNVYRETIVK